jgi:hypothetical protein
MNAPEPVPLQAGTVVAAVIFLNDLRPNPKIYYYIMPSCPPKGPLTKKAIWLVDTPYGNTKEVVVLDTRLAVDAMDDYTKIRLKPLKRCTSRSVKHLPLVLEAVIWRTPRISPAACTVDLSGNNTVNAIHHTNPEETNPMSYTITITDKTLVNDNDVAEMSDDELIQCIRDAQLQVERLMAINVTSKRIEAKVANLRAGVERLVEILDSRE